MNPKRVFWIAGIAAILYTGFAVWVINTFEIPPIRGAVLAIVVLAAAAQIGAKWFFGLLFKESIEETGAQVSSWSAFKAALVGAGVARLIPAGGAITPVALSWTVREEVNDSTVGPALRTVMLNYAALLILAGGGIMLERPEEAIAVASTSLFVVSPIVLIIGLVLMFGSGRLGSISKYLPKIIRSKVEDSMINHLPGLKSQFFIWMRLLLEAAAFWLVMAAFGIDLTALEATAVFAASQIVGGLPGMPGGLGVTEGTLAVLLAAYGFAIPTTVAPIIIFRVVSYWLPAGLSFLAGGSTFLRSPEAKAAAESSS